MLHRIKQCNGCANCGDYGSTRRFHCDSSALAKPATHRAQDELILPQRTAREFCAAHKLLSKFCAAARTAHVVSRSARPSGFSTGPAAGTASGSDGFASLGQAQFNEKNKAASERRRL